MRFQPTQCHHDAVLGESDILTLALAGADEVLATRVSGELDACDVWFRGPAEWLEARHHVTIRLYARHAEGRAPIGEVYLYDTAHEVAQGVVSAWVFAARGIPAHGFEVTYQRGGEGPEITGGRIFIRAGENIAEPALLSKSGIAGLRSIAVSNVVQVQPIEAVTVTQAQPSLLQATVVQPSASALQATVFQANPSGLQATVTQTNASSLQATVVQPTASALQATVVQSSAYSLHATAAQGVAASAAGRWPVYLTDGSVALGTTSAPLYAARIRDGAATYSAVSGVFSAGSTTGVKSVAYLWHPSTGSGSSKRVEIRRITLSYAGGSGTGPIVFHATRINAVSATPGGTAVAATPMDLGDAAGLSIMTAATSPPTRQGGDVFSIAVAGSANDTFTWQPLELGKPLVLRASMAEGIEVYLDVQATLSPVMRVTVSFEWVEV